MEGEGLLLTPISKNVIGNVIVLTDADQSPEMSVGLVEGIPREQQVARIYAERGCRVVVPVLIDRSDTYSITRIGRATNQPHREFIYRPAFEMGRHIVGYEVHLGRCRGCGRRIQPRHRDQTSDALGGGRSGTGATGGGPGSVAVHLA